MVRKLSLLLGLVFFVSFAAHAQGITDKLEVFGGYSFMHNDNRPDGNLNGWEISGQYKFSNWLGLVADFDGHYGSPNGFGTQKYNYLFGPQISFPARVSPFVHLLIGGSHEHVDSVGSDSSFAAALGAGIDTKVSGPFYWRIIQGDWIHTSLFGGSQNNGRLSTGIVIKF
jgi:hypothetical protein